MQVTHSSMAEQMKGQVHSAETKRADSFPEAQPLRGLWKERGKEMRSSAVCFLRAGPKPCQIKGPVSSRQSNQLPDSPHLQESSCFKFASEPLLRWCLWAPSPPALSPSEPLLPSGTEHRSSQDPRGCEHLLG